MRIPHLRRLAALAVALLATVGCGTETDTEPTAAPEDLTGEWRQWRGPNGQGVSAETGLPTRWAPGGNNIHWQARVPGISNSSPIVSGGKVFLTTAWGQRKFRKFGQNETLRRAVVAFDVESGEKLWETIVFRTGQERRHHLNTPAAATPLADGERVYVYFGMGLAALDYDGNVVWEREVDPNYIERARYGVVSSPVLVGDAVVITRDDEWGGDTVQDISWLAAYDRRTGAELWRTEHDETCCSYTTPVVRPTANGPELIFASTPFVAAYDPASGERLWSIEHTLRQIVPTTILSDDLLILPGSVHMRSVAVLRLQGQGSATTHETLWGTTRSSPKIPSAVVLDGNLILLTDNGILVAHDPVTGQRRWQQRLEGGNYRSSLVAGDGQIYATNDRCATTVVDSEGKVRGRNQLEGNCEATAAIAGGRLYIRTATELYSIERSVRNRAGKRKRGGENAEATTESSEAED